MESGRYRHHGTKYFRKAGTQASRSTREKHAEWLQPSVPDQANSQKLKQLTDMDRKQTRRFSPTRGCWTYWGHKHGYFNEESDARHFMMN